MNEEIKSAVITIAATFFIEIGNALVNSQSIEWTVAGLVGIALAAARAALKVGIAMFVSK